MALPSSGAISFNSINVELGVAGTTQASLNQASYRALAGVPSGQISMSSFYGKSSGYTFTLNVGENYVPEVPAGREPGSPAQTQISRYNYPAGVAEIPAPFNFTFIGFAQSTDWSTGYTFVDVYTNGSTSWSSLTGPAGTVNRSSGTIFGSYGGSFYRIAGTIITPTYYGSSYITTFYNVNLTFK